MKFFHPGRSFYFIAIFVYVLDRITKIMVNHSFVIGDSYPVISGLFNLTYVANDGVAFGFFRGNNFLLGCVAVLILGLAWWFAKDLDWKRLSVNVLAACILGGALGNLTDRFIHGYVVDFLDFYVGSHHWPAFNVADACISCSVVYILLGTVFSKGKTSS